MPACSGQPQANARRGLVSHQNSSLFEPKHCLTMVQRRASSVLDCRATKGCGQTGQSVSCNVRVDDVELSQTLKLREPRYGPIADRGPSQAQISQLPAILNSAQALIVD